MIWLGFAFVILGGYVATQNTQSKISGPMVTIGIVLLILSAFAARAHDDGQWNNDPALRDWYQALMQPDNPNTSCCGEADAYFCDDYYARDGRAYCRITDDRPDEPRHRPHVDVGTEIEIPPYKLKFDRGNPTGHSVVFISRQQYVYCFVQAGGA
jgi:hypothetical protein